MSIQRYKGSEFTEVAGRKRWIGSAWVDLTLGRRWNGSTWVDLWNNESSSDDSGGSSGEGDLFSKLSSTVSQPTVNYKAHYTKNRNGTNLTVSLIFSAWLNSSASHLGTGIKLTVFTRLNGGTWNSTVLKNNADSWSGTSLHTCNVALSGNTSADNATVEFYVSRTGSSYSGTAGSLASAGSPKKYTI